MGSKPARALSMPRGTCQGRGFTLMELLISFSLIGLVAVFIHQGFSVGINSREKAEVALQHIQATEAALDVVSRQIGSMVPYASRQQHESAPVEVLLFQVSGQSLSFVSSYSATSRSSGGLHLVQYFAAPSKSGGHRLLLLNERPLPRDSRLLGSVITGIFKTEDNRFLAELAAPGFGPDSLTLVEGLSSVVFRSLSRPREESLGIDPTNSAPLHLSGRLGRLSRMSPELFNLQPKREQLPAGIEMRLKWKEQGPFGSKEFAIAVPVQAS